mmetsp:Transcript_794/g.2066  ORF Transcript_794/g.2066 Transcript_794/m.2066 type:complete len:229 (+) Transcript_794:2036-2722(+)
MASPSTVSSSRRCFSSTLSSACRIVTCSSASLEMPTHDSVRRSDTSEREPPASLAGASAPMICMSSVETEATLRLCMRPCTLVTSSTTASRRSVASRRTAFSRASNSVTRGVLRSSSTFSYSGSTGAPSASQSPCSSSRTVFRCSARASKKSRSSDSFARAASRRTTAGASAGGWSAHPTGPFPSFTFMDTTLASADRTSSSMSRSRAAVVSTASVRSSSMIPPRSSR